MVVLLYITAAYFIIWWHPSLVHQSILCGAYYSLLMLVIVFDRVIDAGDVLDLSTFGWVLVVMLAAALANCGRHGWIFVSTLAVAPLGRLVLCFFVLWRDLYLLLLDNYCSASLFCGGIFISMVV